MEVKYLTLKQARLLADLSQEKAADLIGISKNTLINWEKSRTYPSADMVERIEKTFNVPHGMITFVGGQK